MVSEIRVPANATTGTATVPAPSGFFQFTQTTSATLILRNDLNPSMPLTMPVTIVFLMTTAPPVSTTATTATSSTRLRPAAISQFAPASSVWPNKTLLVVNWNYSGTAPANQTVIVTLQVPGRTFDLCPATWVGKKSCPIAAMDWSTVLKTATNGTLTLIDGASRAPVSSPVALAVQVP
jgi:hypothetical protein